jgi:hypothetical protein
MSLGKIWNISSSDYFDNSKNVGVDHYNSFETFIKNSKLDPIVKQFNLDNFFQFLPSYGSSVSIDFMIASQQYENQYTHIAPGLINTFNVNFQLNFDSRSDEEALKINNFFENSRGAKQFPMQFTERSKVSDEDSYKSLYSIPPYLIQWFRNPSLEYNNTYHENNSLRVSFLNQDFSHFNSKYILYAKSLPQTHKDVIEEYMDKYNLDINPSYPYNLSTNFSSLNTSSFLSQSRNQSSDNGRQASISVASLVFDKISNLTLLKLLSFFISKRGFETFDFQDKEGNVFKFSAPQIEHTYLFKNSHTLKVICVQEFVDRRFHWKY